MHPDARDDDRRITYFAATHTRGKREMFGIRAVDRGKHVYVIGKTGMGKSTMLENMAIQDIQHGEGIAYIDPHGSTAEKLLDFVPHDRINDVIYFAPFDVDYPMGFNVMEDVGFDQRHLVVAGLMGSLKRIWVDAWSARMEYILQNTLLALLEYPGSTLIDVNRMLTNKTFRNAVIERVTDPIVKAFWTEEFAAFTDTYTREATPAIQNKIGQFVSNPLVRNIVGQPTSSFNLRQMMDEKKIFIVNLSKGRMGESNAALLGSMLTVKIYLAAMSRAEEPPARLAKLPRCFFYVDEFQSMMNEAFADILSESRKYKLALTLANQYIEQMDEEVRDAVFGNVGTLITFRVGPFDAETLKTVFEPTFEAEDLIGLGIGQIYLTLMIDGVGSPPFSAETIPPIEAPNISYKDDVITQSRATYGRRREDVEETIAAKQKEFIPPPVLSKTQIRKIEGSGNYPPRPPSSASSNASTMTAPRPPALPAPVPFVARPTIIESPTPPPVVRLAVPPAAPREAPAPVVAAPKPADQRSALRAAIDGARTAAVQSSAPVRAAPVSDGGAIKSPAELLRARMKSAPAPISNPTPVSASPRPLSRETLHRNPPSPVVPSERTASRPPQRTERRNEPVPRVPPRPQTYQQTREREYERERVTVPERNGAEEISPELLRRVISGNQSDGGHDENDA